MGLVEIVGFTLNKQLVYGSLGIFDSGGSTVIHTFGAYFGLTVSLILGKAVKQKQKPSANYNSNIFAMIGTLFLWMYWPSFNAAYYPEHPF
jgi:ammonium transporter Rh